MDRLYFEQLLLRRQPVLNLLRIYFIDNVISVMK